MSWYGYKTNYADYPEWLYILETIRCKHFLRIKYKISDYLKQLVSMILPSGKQLVYVHKESSIISIHDIINNRSLESLLHDESVLDFFVNNIYIVSITAAQIYFFDVHTYKLIDKSKLYNGIYTICNVTIPRFPNEYEVIGRIKEQIRMNDSQLERIIVT